MSTKKMHPPAVIHPTTGQTGGKGSLLPVACGKTTAKDRQNVENIVPSQNGTASSGAVEPQPNGNAAVSVPSTAVAPGKKAPNAAKTVAPAAATAVQSRRKNHRHSNMSPSRKRQEQQTIFNSLRAWNVKIVTQEKCAAPVSTTTTTTTSSSNEATAAKVISVPTQTDKSSTSAVSVGKPAATSSNTSSSSSISNVTSSNSISGSIKAKKQQSQLMVAATVPVQGTKETVTAAVVGKGEQQQQQQKKVEVATATENQPAAKKEPAPSSAGSSACETGSKADGKTTVGANASGSAPTTAGKDERKLLNSGTNSFGGRHSVAIPPPPSSLTAPSSSLSAGSGSSLLLHSSSSSPVGAAIPVVSTAGSGNCSSSKHSSSRASNAGKVLLPNVNPLEQFAVLQGKLRNSMTAPPLPSQQSHHNHAHHPHSSAAHNHQQQSQQQQQQQQSIPSSTTTSPQYSLDFLHYVGMRMSGTGGTTSQSTAAAAAQAAALFRGNPHFNYSNFNQQLHPQQQPTQQQQQHLQRHYSGYYEEMMVPMGGTGGGDAGPPLYNGGATGYPVADHLVNGAAATAGNSANNAGGDSLAYCYSQSHQHNQHQNQHHLQHNHPPQQPYGNGSFHQNNNYQQHNRNYGRGGQPNGAGGNMQGRKTWNNNNNSWHGNGKRSNMMQGGKYGGGINGYKGPNVSHGGYRKSYNYYNNNSNHHNYHNHTNSHHHDPHQQQHQDHLRSLRYIGRGQGDASSSQESTSRSPTPSPQSESPAIDTASDVAKASNAAGSSASSVQDEKSDSGIEDGAATLKKSGAVPSSSSSSSSVVSIPSTDSAISSAVSQNLSLELNGATGHGYESDSSHSSSYNSHSYRHRKYANGGQVYRSSSSTSSGVSSTATFPPLVADFAMQTSTSAVNTPTASATSQQVADLFLRSQSYHGSHQNLTTVSGSASPNPPDSPVGAARPLVGTQSMPMFSELFTGQQHHNLHNHHHHQQQQPRTRPNSSYGSNSSLDSTLQNVIAGTPASASASSNNSNCSIVSNTSSSGYGSAPTSTVPPNEAYSMQSGHPRRRFSGRSSPAPYTEQSNKPNRSSFGGSINTAVNNSSQQQPPSPPSHSRKGQQPAWSTHRPGTVPTSTATTAVPPPAPQVPPPSTSVPPPPVPTTNSLPFIHPIDGGTNYHTPADRFLARSHLVELLAPPQDLAPAGSKWAALSGAVWDKFAAAQQTQHKFVQKIQLWRYLFMCIRKAFPRFSLYLVGSTISGFASDNSDVDMCLVCRANTIPFDMRGEALFQLGQLKNYFMNINTYFEEFSVIQAKVPILRFRDSTNSIVVDLNYNNCVGIRNTHLLYCYSQLDWRLRPLTLVVKLWAQHHNINDAKNMTISSYSLVLMVIHFLQYGVSPPILPCLHAMYPDKFVRMSDISNLDLTETMEPYKNENAQPLGELFMQFLEYYANFDYTQYAISVRTASVIPIESARVARSYKNDPHHWRQLCIEEPFDLTNTARSVFDAEIFEQIKSVFSTSWRRLKDTNDLGSIFECDPLFIPVASTLSITS